MTLKNDWQDGDRFTHTNANEIADEVNTLAASSNAYAETIGDGVETSYAITHGLGTEDVVVSTYIVTTGEEINCDKYMTDTDTVTLEFATAPTTNQVRCVIVGTAYGSGDSGTVSTANISDATTIGRALLTAADAAAAKEAINISVINVKDLGAIGDGSSHAASTLIGGSGYASLAALREDYWSGVRFAEDDAVAVIDPFLGGDTLYIAAGDEYAHITYNTTSGAITETLGTGGITVGAGVLTGTSGVDGDITISGTASVLYVENRTGAKIAVTWSEAQTTDEVDWLAIQHAVSAAALQADTVGGIAEVRIPPGTYLFNRSLYVFSNTKIINQGHLKLTGGDNLGGFVIIQNAVNTELVGGIWDANQQGNDNAIGITRVGLAQTVMGPLSENVWIHDLIIQGARHGGASIVDDTDPANVGAGGGKGLTIQFGGTAVLLSNVVIQACDIGLSIEGKESGAGYAQSIVVENSVVKNCRYMGLLLTSVQNTPALFGQTASAMFNNVEIVDCGVGQTIDASPQDISDLFGAITCQSSVAFRGDNIKVRSTTGKMTVFRGAINNCNWDVQVIAGGELVDLVNTAPFGGHNPTNTASRYSKFTFDVLILSTFSGYFVNSDATYQATTSMYDISVIYWNGSAWAATAEAKYSNSLPSTSNMTVTDKATGLRNYIPKRYRSVTVASGALVVIPTDEQLNVLCEGGVSDSLGAMTGGTFGQTVTLVNAEAVPGTAVLTVVVNPITNGFAINANYALNTATAWIRLRHNGTNWVEVAREHPTAATATLNFGVLSANSYEDLTITVTGAATGDCVSLGVPTAAVTAGVAFTAWVSAADTVTVRAHNYTAGTPNPGSGTFKAAIVR